MHGVNGHDQQLRASFQSNWDLRVFPDAMMASEHVRPVGPGDELFPPRANRIQISVKILNALDERPAPLGHLVGRMANPGDLVPPSFTDIVRLLQGDLQNGRMLCSIASDLL
jgi:hypothetical protein